MDCQTKEMFSTGPEERLAAVNHFWDHEIRSGLHFTDLEK